MRLIKTFIALNENYYIDFAPSGNFNNLLGFEKTNLKKSAYGKNFPNITDNLDNIYIKCSLLSDSIISGKRSNILDSFATSTKTRSLPFEIQRTNYLWNKINNIK